MNIKAKLACLGTDDAEPIFNLLREMSLRIINSAVDLVLYCQKMKTTQNLIGRN